MGTRSAPRTRLGRFRDTLSFPLRALTLFYEDRFGLSALASERYDYVASRVIGRCLDMGCGSNRFVNEYLNGDGVGVDVFEQDGATGHLILQDLSRLPFPDGSFDSATFIANLNHVPEPLRAPELAEAFRVLRAGGNIIVTMGLPVAELLVHRVVSLYDRVLGTSVDHDGRRGMAPGEAYYLTGAEIRRLLAAAAFQRVTYQPFLTQWGLNGMYVGWKP